MGDPGTDLVGSTSLTMSVWTKTATCTLRIGGIIVSKSSDRTVASLSVNGMTSTVHALCSLIPLRIGLYVDEWPRAFL